MSECDKCREKGFECKCSGLNPKKSAFYQFRLLPEVCIHSLDEDQYSIMYTPQKTCDCGCSEWIESTMKMFEDRMGYVFPLKRVHRCKSCNEVRIASHVGTI